MSVLTEETLIKANSIKKRIDGLQEEIKEFPRYIIDQKEYKKSGCMYVKRFLVREKYKLKIPKGYYLKDLEYELSEEDLQALVDIRLRKIEQLQKDLSELN